MSNSLAKVHPELVSEWAERNFPLTPDDITYGSNKRVWWKGSCGHEWQASVKARSKGEGCPICSGARVVAGINDFATINPRLVSEWSEKNTIKPTEVNRGLPNPERLYRLWLSEPENPVWQRSRRSSPSKGKPCTWRRAAGYQPNYQWKGA